MSGYNNGNPLGFNPFGNNVPNNGLNISQQFAQTGGIPNQTLNPSQLAMLATQQRQAQQLQQAAAAQQFASVRPSVMRTNSPTPAQFLNSMQGGAMAGQRQGQSSAEKHQQLTAAIEEVVKNPGLKPEIRRAILSGHIPAEKIFELAKNSHMAKQMAAQHNGTGHVGVSNVYDPSQVMRSGQTIRPTHAQLPTSISPALMSNRNSFSPGSQGSPNTTPLPLVSGSEMQRQLSGGQAYHPSVLSTPPQPSSTSSRMPSPPRAGGRRESVNQGQQAVQTPNQVSTPNPAINPSTVSNIAANPGIAAVIPPLPPASFKLDESKLRVKNNAPTGAGVSSAVGSSGPSTSTSLGSLSLPPASSGFLGSVLPVSTPRPAPYVPTAPFRHAGAPRPTEGRYVEYAGERKKGMEGMRGSMRNEIARLMYAAGDEPEPDANAVDYMEDLVVEFLADLSRPVAPMRANIGAAHYPVPLTTGIIRDRLSPRPVFKKYLDRFDIMAYLTGEINKNRRTFQNQESYNDLVDTVGRDYLEMDAAEKAKINAANAKKRGRPKKGDGKEELEEVEKEEPQAKRKPGPKKGWKAARAAAPKGEAEPARIGADGRKIKKKYKRKKEGTVGRETSVVSGGEGYASPA